MIIYDDISDKFEIVQIFFGIFEGKIWRKNEQYKYSYF